MPSTAQLVSQTATGYTVSQDWVAEGYADIEAARAAVVAAAPASFAFNGVTLNRDDAGITLRNATDDPANKDDYIATVNYASAAATAGPSEEQAEQAEQVEDELVADGVVWSFSVGGGSTHVTTGTNITNYGDVEPEVEGVVGASKDGVAGVDIPNNAMTFSIKKRLVVDAAVVTTISATVGKVNTDAFKGLAAGECLFLGLQSGDFVLGQKAELTYQFAVQLNATGLTVPGIAGTITKKGWEYLDLYYQKIAGDKTLIHKPVGAQVIAVLKTAAFAPLGL